ncbi:MAG TPA: hypothetical protein VKH14_02560 [Candidatus Udaeobacter sp.]|nr:hypothetical protein [Candidatus Udaeobacter sp.]
MSNDEGMPNPNDQNALQDGLLCFVIVIVSSFVIELRHLILA